MVQAGLLRQSDPEDWLPLVDAGVLLPLDAVLAELSFLQALTPNKTANAAKESNLRFFMLIDFF
ncbi:MAG: hypothetical protein U0T81_02945 [Saprospiraceae bacterium]